MNVLHCPFNIRADLRLLWEILVLDFHQTWVTFELSGLVQVSPDQTGSSRFSLTCQVSEGREPAESSCTLQYLPCPTTDHAGKAEGSLVRLTCAAVMPFCCSLVSYSRAQRDLAYTWIFCAAGCLKSSPSFH